MFLTMRKLKNFSAPRQRIIIAFSLLFRRASLSARGNRGRLKKKKLSIAVNRASGEKPIREFLFFFPQFQTSNYSPFRAQTIPVAQNSTSNIMRLLVAVSRAIKNHSSRGSPNTRFSFFNNFVAISHKTYL